MSDHRDRMNTGVAPDHARDVLERVSDAVVALDRNWRYVYVNSKAGRLFGRRPEDLIGRHIWTEFPEGVGQPFHLAYERAMAEQVFIQMESYYEPWDRWFENRIYPAPDGVSIFFHEITDRKLAERDALENAELVRGQNRVLELIARGEPLPHVLDQLLRVIEAQSPGMLTSILLLDSDGIHVRHGAAPSLPNEFVRSIDGQPIGPSAGSCGTAAFRREAVVVEDIASDPLWAAYREGALAHGLRACWSTPILDDDGSVLGTFAIYFREPARPTEEHRRLIELSTHTAAIAIAKHRDMQATVQREAQLAEAQRLAHLGSYEWDVRTNLVHRSDELCRIFGIPCEEFEPTFEAYLERVHPDDRANTRRIIEQSARDRTSFQFEERIVRPDGSVRVLHSQGSWSVDENKQPVKLLGICQDITERRQAEDQIRRSEERFQMVARATNDAVWDWHLGKNSVWWNQGISTLFGYAASDVEPHIDWRAARIHPDDLDNLVAGVREVTDTGTQFWSREYRFRRADGSYADVLDRAFVIYNAAGRAVRMIGAMTDISERKRAVEILEQRVAMRTAELQDKNQELEGEIIQRRRVAELLRDRNEELKAFAYTVSHDLKAPLRGIAGYAHELQRRHQSGLTARGVACIEHIVTATSNLDRLIEDLLHYSRLDAETPSSTAVDLAQMIDGILRDRRPVVREQKVEIDVALGVTTIHTWERGLLQMLANLIDNAIKYSRNATPPRVRIASEDHGQIVRIVISDNGIGFDPKYRDRIFGLFNRLVRQEDFDGTGAGLAIVKKIAEKMGARVWGESQPGSGASFYLEIPRDQGASGDLSR
jgi:PAS domain S-box-containing protein